MRPDLGRPFKLWQSARLAAVLAAQMQTVALGWHVYGVTGEKLDLGLLGLAQFLPVMLFSLVAGELADRVDRRRLVTACLAANAALSALLLVAALAVPERVWPIYAVAVGLGTVHAFQAPAQKAMLPSLVPLGHLERAVAWSSGTFQIATIGGPAVGGLVLALAGDRPWAVYLAAALLATIAAVVSAGVVVARAAAPPTRAAGLLTGVRFVLHHPLLLGAMSLDLGAVLLGGATALLPVFAKDILDAGSIGLGVLRAAPALGAGAMALWLARHPIGGRAGKKLFVSVVVFGLGTIGFGLSRDLGLSIACLALAGAADMVSMVIRGVLVQAATPEHMRGRVSAVSSVFIVASNDLGEFESGVMAAWVGTVPAVVLGGVLSIGIVAACAVAFPTLRRADRLDRIEPSPST